MRKEGIVAIVFGIILGLIIAFGIYRVNSTIKNNITSVENAKMPEEPDSTSNTSSANNAGSLTLLKPEDKKVFGSDIIQISGVTHAESYIVTTGGTYDNVVKPSADGSFSFEYNLEPANNYIEVTAVTLENTRTSKKLEIVYSSEAATESDNSTDGDIADKVSQAINRLEFYKGTVTDITEGAIQIKNGNGEIKQISYTKENTTFAKIAKTTTKLSDSDVGIGDYILAMGTKKENGVLDSFRILVTQPDNPQSIGVFFGQVDVKNKSDMVVSENNSADIVITIDNNTKTYKGDVNNPTKIRFADVSAEDIVIGTYYTEKDENVARRIYILDTTEEE